ncbi:hypothetical protein PIN31009_04348 [Pandoraea iniqua]|uniref:RCC1 domain-containing protein n=1 Tax=Pandoraea iniqua TaxID=2508288 RepID=UPI001241EFAC|nr:RCC1 domain-containing protein [Pandoraea iniqua]VVE45544.1 hypothetical protein PIN31009_04348 [Pandoraea iniqua]
MRSNDPLFAFQRNSSARMGGGAASARHLLAPVTRDDTVRLGKNIANLEPPQVPAATVYGGIGYRDVRDANGQIFVVIKPNSLFKVGDTLTLYWGDANRPVAQHTLVAGENFFPVTMQVNVADVLSTGDGVIDVWFDLTSIDTGDTTTGAPLAVIVKTTLPGGPDPDPVTSPWVNENLAPPTIPPGIIGQPEATDGVPVTVPAWINMAPGDVLCIRWGTQSVYWPALTAAEVGRPVVVVIDYQTIIDAGDSPNLVVTYDIDDIVREWSLNSLPAFAEVEAGDATLDPPVVLQAPAGELDHDALGGDDADIVITFQDPEMAVGDTLHIVFEGLSSEGREVHHEFDVPIASDTPFVTAKLPNGVIGDAAPGSASLFYIVRDGNGDKGRSQRNSLTILGQPARLPAPIVTEANGNDLDPADAVTGANVVITAWPDMAAQDAVTLRWEGVKASGAPWVHIEEKIIAAADAGQPVNFLVPPAYVADLAGGSVTVYYIVDPAAPEVLPRESARVTLRVLGEAALPAPDVEGVADGELNPPADPVEGVEVIIPVWELMSVGDVLEAFWEGQSPGGTVTGTHTLAAADLNQPYVFLVPREFVDANAAGRDFVDVWYRVTRNGQTTSQTSAITRFRVLAQAPDLLPPPEVDEAEGDVLDPAPLPAAGATVRVAPYAGMTAGDAITIRFGVGSGGGEHTDTFDVSQNMVGQDVTMRVPKTKVEFHLGSTVIVNYTVHRLDGREEDSENRELQVRSELKWPAPVVDEAEGDYLDPELAVFGVTTRVRGYAGMLRDDRVVLHWGNPGDDGYYVDSITLSTARDYQFQLLAADVAPWIGRTVPIHYEVERGAQRFVSETLLLRIGTGSSTDLIAPEVLEAEAGVLDLSTLTTHATASIPVYDGMRSGDYIHLTWGGGPGSGGAEWFIDVTGNQVGKPITRHIPMDNLTSFDGKDVVLAYTVDNGTPPVLASEEYTVRVERGAPSVWAPPRVPEVVDGILDPRDVVQGAEVVVDFVEGMRQGDTVRMHWDCTIAAGSDTQDKIVGSSQTPIAFLVDRAKVLAGVDGSIEAWYEVIRAGNVVATSETFGFAIKLSELPLAVIDQADGKTLDPDDVPASGATITLDATALFQPGDRVVLSWEGAPGSGSGEYSHTVSAGEAGGAIKITVPKAVVEANNGVTVVLRYTVTRAAGGAVETSGENIYDVRRELGSGELLVMGARYCGSAFRSFGMPQYLHALHRTTTADLLAEWRYEDDVSWGTGVTFKDTRPWMPLRVRSATHQVTINPVNIVGSGAQATVAGGSGAFVARLARRNVIGWGFTTYGGTVPAGIIDHADVVEVSSTTAAYAVRRASGRVAAWGNTTLGGAIPGDGANLTDVVRVHPNAAAFTAVRGAGYLTAWGAATLGGALSDEAQGLTDVTSVAGTAYAFCALRRSGQVVAWGNTTYGGNVPDAIKGLTDMYDVRANCYAFCGLRENGTVVAWGDAGSGAGVPDDIAARTDIVELSSASIGAFAVRTRTDQVLAWGFGSYGGTVPPAIASLTDIAEVTATWYAFCAVRGNGAVVAWGHESYGGAVPVEIARLGDIVQVASSSGAFAALRRNGTVVAWGIPTSGGDTSSVVDDLVNIRAVYGNNDAFVAIKASGGAVTWGQAAAGGNSDAVKALLDTDLFYESSAGGTQRKPKTPHADLSTLTVVAP